MENFSEAYLRAVASAAGFWVETVGIDFDSVDAWINTRGYIEELQ